MNGYYENASRFHQCIPYSYVHSRNEGAMSRAVPVVVEIIEGIAAREGIDPVRLDTPLDDVIDTDALEALTNQPQDQQPPAALHVQFVYYGYSVTVDGTGAVTIDERAPGTNSTES